MAFVSLRRLPSPLIPLVCFLLPPSPPFSSFVPSCVYFFICDAGYRIFGALLPALSSCAVPQQGRWRRVSQHAYVASGHLADGHTSRSMSSTFGRPLSAPPSLSSCPYLWCAHPRKPPPPSQASTAAPSVNPPAAYAPCGAPATAHPHPSPSWNVPPPPPTHASALPKHRAARGLALSSAEVPQSGGHIVCPARRPARISFLWPTTAGVCCATGDASHRRKLSDGSCIVGRPMPDTPVLCQFPGRSRFPFLLTATAPRALLCSPRCLEPTYAAWLQEARHARRPWLIDRSRREEPLLCETPHAALLHRRLHAPSGSTWFGLDKPASVGKPGTERLAVQVVALNRD